MGFLDFLKGKEKPSKQERARYKKMALVETKKGDYEKFTNKLLKKSIIMLIIGKRGSGKTSLGMKLLEFFRYSGIRKCYVVGYASTKLPAWMKKVESIEKAPENAVVLIDEGAIGYFSRDSMKQANKMLSKIMTIARHKNLTVIIITQNSAMLDINVLRLADTLVFKEPSLLQSRFERKALKDMFEKVAPHFKKLNEPKANFYVWDDDFEGLLSYDLPAFWSDEISRSFKGFGK
jgi:ABC-type phosphate transport system substrate-binding protein